MITKKYYKLIRVSHEDEQIFYIKNTSDSLGNFKVNKSGNPQTIYLKYSTDGVNWENYDFSTLPSIQVNSGSNIYLKGNNPNGILPNPELYGSYYFLSMDVNHIAGGNICSLISESNFDQITSLSAGAFYCLFNQDEHLTDVSAVTLGNVTTVASSQGSSTGTFAYMFRGCTNLERGLDLSGIDTISSNKKQICSYMYAQCSKLEKATALNIQDLSTGNVLIGWLQQAGSSATGTKTVNVPAGATIATGSDSGIPTGWTRVDY